MISSLWTRSLVVGSFPTKNLSLSTIAAWQSSSSRLLTSALETVLIFGVIPSYQMWLLSLATLSGNRNNSRIMIGVSGLKLSIWPLDPNSSLQFLWEVGYDIHTNQQSTFPTTQLWISSINQVTTGYGRFFLSSPMLWSPIALCAIHTPELPLWFPPQPTTSPLHPQAQPKRSTFRAPARSLFPLHLPPPCLTTSSTYGKIDHGRCTPQSSQTMARQQRKQFALVRHTGFAMDRT